MNKQMKQEMTKMLGAFTLAAMLGACEARDGAAPMGELELRKSQSVTASALSLDAEPEVQLCVERLRFKKLLPGDDASSSDTDTNTNTQTSTNTSTSFSTFRHSDDDLFPEVGHGPGHDEVEDNVDFSLGAVALNGEGVLGQVRVPQGRYRRVEFRLSNNCGVGYSLQVDNAWGRNVTTEKTRLRFDGVFEVSEGSQVLQIYAEQIIEALKDLRPADSLEDRLAGVGGRIHQ